jgi:long-subunit acyl-CoA synthetase (AMP-forming)
MTQTTQPAVEGDAIAEALKQQSLPAAFQVTAAAMGDAPALRDHGSDDVVSWAEYGARVRTVAAGLAALGIGKGDTVALMMGNRTEFHLVDVGAMHLGAVPFSIYQTNPAPQILPMIEIAKPRVIVAEAQYLPVVRQVIAETDSIEKIVLLDGDGEDDTMTLAELEGLGSADFDFDGAWQSIGPDDFATIVFSSGTTGRPKGVDWSHGALLANLRAQHIIAPVSPNGRVVSALPMAHLLERFVGHWSQIAFGYQLTALADAKQLGAALGGTRPTRFYGVPRILEKLVGGAKAIAGSSPELQAAFDENLELVRKDAHAVENDPARIEAVRPIRQKLGLDDAEWRLSAGAPARVDILEGFAALGLPVAETWGMSESAMSLMNPPTKVKFGTVGKPTEGFEAKRAEDGEMLLKGPIFSGYHGQPEMTAEAVVDGWLHTGDVIEIDDEGYIKVVDRKKELLINSAGKNIAPVMVENRVKQQSPLVGQVVALCDQQPYLTALVVVDEEALVAFAAEKGLEGSPEELRTSPEVAAEVDRAIAAANETLARIEQIKKHTLLDEFWVPGTNEVTNTMKLRRKNIAKSHAEQIAALYA